jgi:hypothetical protein
MIGNQKVAVSVDHALGSLSILQINTDGVYLLRYKKSL